MLPQDSAHESRTAVDDAYPATIPPQRDCESFTVIDPASVAAARSYARGLLDEWHLAPLQESVELIVSEMVTNALVHTDGPATLELGRSGDRVRIVVSDHNPLQPHVQDTLETEAVHGRGMFLVEALSEDWGVSASARGKYVWADVSLEAAC